jgi:hypothetical protein
VQGEIEDSRPGVALLAPDEDFAVIGGGCEDVAEFGVRPGDGPDCSFVAVVDGQLGWTLGCAMGRLEQFGTTHLSKYRGWGNVKGQSYPFSVSVNRCVSPSTSKILTVRSEEQVARRRP